MKRWQSYIKENRGWFKTYSALKKAGMTVEAKEAKITKHMAKHAVWLAQSEAEFATVSLDGDGVFCMATQMDRTNQDIVGENCVHNDAGKLVLIDKDKMKV